ncbi:Hypothetical predicted protein, partial [Paramuricea clavata]
MKAATSNGAELRFAQDSGELTLEDDGTIVEIEEHGQLYYLTSIGSHENDSVSEVDKVNLSYDINTWHEILGAVFVYFLKCKSDTFVATEKFLADITPYGKNGTAERHWRTLFEMGTFNQGYPKLSGPMQFKPQLTLGIYVLIREQRQHPTLALLGKYLIFLKCGSLDLNVLLTYEQEHKKLDSRCSKGVFVGYDKNSPSYLVYNPQNGKIMKHRLIRFIKKGSVEQHTQTDESSRDCDVHEKSDHDTRSDLDSMRLPVLSAIPPNAVPDEEPRDSEGRHCDHTENDSETKRYPQRERNPPRYLEEDTLLPKNADYAHISVDYCYKVCGLPQNYTEAMGSPQAREWEQAMKEEISSLKENDIYELSTLPEGKASVGRKWVYTTKQDQNGIEIFKARYVAKGYSQVKGIDYQEIFAPTASITSIRVLMQLAVKHDLIVHQMDVKTAYLHAPITQELYIDQPQGFEEVSESSERNHADHCVYKKQVNDKIVIVIVWVDDLIIASDSMQLMEEFKESMKTQFKMKDLGRITFFLGMDFKQSKGEIKMNLKILERFGMIDCKPRLTPCEQRLEFNCGEWTNARQYREMIGSLIYAMTCTRPDLSWIVSKLSQSLSNPRTGDLIAAKHVLRYLKGTVDYELCFKKSDADLQLTAYSDSDWASCLEDRRSTTGHCCTLTEGGPLISWKSRKQPTVAISTCEAEYVALANTAQECLYLTQLLNGMYKEVHQSMK